MIFFETILPSAISIAAVFLFGCIGETLMEKSGHLNLGIPGIMCFGTLGGCLGVNIIMNCFTDDPFNANWFALVIMAVLFSAIFSAFAGLIYAFLTVSLKCNQNVTGLALTTFGAGCSDYFIKGLDRQYFTAASTVINAHLPFADNLGVFGKIFFSYGILVYVAIGLAVAMAIILRKTRIGLSLRAIGENPGTADAVGINITKYKYCAILLGSVIAGFGGLYYIMGYIGGSWSNSSAIQAFGWLALALVIFTIWKPDFAILGSIIFGFLYIIPSYVTGISFMGMKILDLLPYLVTIIVLIITSIIGKRSVQPPAALGLSYFREER